MISPGRASQRHCLGSLGTDTLILDMVKEDLW